MAMCARLWPARSPFYIANYDPEIQPQIAEIRGLGLHFETSVSICNTRPFFAAGHSDGLGYGNISTRDFLTPGEMFMTTCRR